MITGRPTSHSKELEDQAWAYLEFFKKDHGHAIPSLVGLCKVINRGKTTIYRWVQDEDKQFRDIVDAINESQCLELMNKGLLGDFSPVITKLLLHKHGYKQESELTGQGGEPLIPKTAIIEVIHIDKNDLPDEE